MRFLKHPLCLFCAVGVFCVCLIYRHAYVPHTYAATQPLPFSHATHTAADKDWLRWKKESNTNR